MRKIIITFALAIVLVVSGAFVFVMEVDQIEGITETVQSQSTTTKKRVNDSIKYFIFTGSLYDRQGSGTHYLNLVEVIKDPKLGPNDIVIEHNDKFDVQVHIFEDKAEISFISDYSYMDLNGTGTGLNEMLETWKTKKYKEKTYDMDFFNIKIRHGANIKQFDPHSDEYQINQSIHHNEQYNEDEMDA